jgi:outer membrane protein
MTLLAILARFKGIAAIFLTALSISASPAQDVSSMPSAPSVKSPAEQSSYQFNVRDYSKPQSYFPNPFAPYSSRHIEPPSLANTPLINDLMRDGKLYLSINDAVALALENNLDLAIARLNLRIADTDLWHAAAGQSISGTNAGLVQNTPGGGVGGLGSQVGSGLGGTSVGSGGAGAGAGGLVGSTLGDGPKITSFDPVITSTVQIDHLKSQCNTPLCATNLDTTSADFTYTQGFHWGTDMLVDFNTSRLASNSLYNYLNPSLTASFQVRLTQHVLQGFGLASNTRYIAIANNNRQISDVAFRYQIITTVDQIETMYWNLVYAYENVRVQKKQMEFAEKTLANDKQQMEIGTLAPLEVVKAQSMIATDQQTLTVALTNLELAQLLMKNAITRSLVDPILADAEVIPTSMLELPEQEVATSTEDLVTQALSARPELIEARINLANTQISNKAIRSALLPTFDVSAYYGGSGLGGPQNPDYICLSDPQICGLKKPPELLPTKSYGDTLNQLVNSSAPDKGFTFTLNIPIRNRDAQATEVRSQFETQQAALRMQQLENQIRIEVRNALFGVQQNRASVLASQAAADLARQSLETEQKKFELRASTSVLVLQNEAALVQAEATLISAKVAYEKAVVELDRSVGVLLEHAGILMDDAQRGQVSRKPKIPNVPERQADWQTTRAPGSQP